MRRSERGRASVGTALVAVFITMVASGCHHAAPRAEEMPEAKMSQYQEMMKKGVKKDDAAGAPVQAPMGGAPVRAPMGAAAAGAPPATR